MRIRLVEMVSVACSCKMLIFSSIFDKKSGGKKKLRIQQITKQCQRRQRSICILTPDQCKHSQKPKSKHHPPSSRSEHSPSSTSFLDAASRSTTPSTKCIRSLRFRRRWLQFSSLFLLLPAVPSLSRARQSRSWSLRLRRASLSLSWVVRRSTSAISRTSSSCSMVVARTTIAAGGRVSRSPSDAPADWRPALAAALAVAAAGAPPSKARRKAHGWRRRRRRGRQLHHGLSAGQRLRSASQTARRARITAEERGR